MTLKECTLVLGPFVIAIGADFDDIRFKAYHRVLKDVSPALLEVALEDVTKSGARFMPGAPELLAVCEKARRRLLALHPYDGCAECEGHPGYRNVLTDAGQPTVERCPCKGRWQERLSGMGALEPISLLPGEAERESEQVYPTVEQLPAPIRQQLERVAARKQLR